jgi:hypothetical protein
MLLLLSKPADTHQLSVNLGQLCSLTGPTERTKEISPGKIKHTWDVIFCMSDGQTHTRHHDTELEARELINTVKIHLTTQKLA